MSESQGFLVHLQRLVVASQLTVHGGQVAHACALECRKDALDMGHRALDFRERPCRMQPWNRRVNGTENAAKKHVEPNGTLMSGYH